MYKRKILLNNKYKSMKSNCLMKTVNKIAFVVLFLLCISPCFALPDGYEDRYIDDFRYGLFVPPGYDPSVKYHLILYLHGYTDTTSWNFQWYTKEFQSKFPALVLSPKCLVTYTEGWGNSWNMMESYAIKMAFRALDSTLKYYNIHGRIWYFLRAGALSRQVRIGVFDLRGRQPCHRAVAKKYTPVDFPRGCRSRGPGCQFTECF
jgi:hypothetical protein